MAKPFDFAGYMAKRRADNRAKGLCSCGNKVKRQGGKCCAKCIKQVADWNKANPGPQRERIRLRRLSFYGLTIDQYQEILNRQDGKCIGCGSKDGLCIDHDHKTGRVRGILCRSCNLAIGSVKENVNTMDALMRYLIERK